MFLCRCGSVGALLAHVGSVLGLFGAHLGSRGQENIVGSAAKELFQLTRVGSLQTSQSILGLPARTAQALPDNQRASQHLSAQDFLWNSTKA